jgi:DNA-binding CsgD family transcriptional regulator
VTFGLYSKICVRNAMISLLRKLRTGKRRKPAAGGREPVAEETRARLPDPEAVVGLAAGSLSKLEAEIIGRYAAGDKPSQIAASLGKSEKTVYNALYRAKTKIRKLR